MNNKFRSTIASAAAVASALTLIGAAAGASASLQGSGKKGDIDLTAPAGGTIEFGGSSFSAPFVDYTTTGQHSFSTLNHNVTFGSDSAAGSGNGRSGVEGGTYEIGFSDQPLNVAAGTAPSGDTTQAQVDSQYAQVPYVLGGAVMGYNLPGIKSLDLSAKVVADIYEGTITKWNDPAIIKLNKADAKKLAALPSSDINIKPLYRSASSGTTFAFTNWLNAAGATTNKVSGSVLSAASGWGGVNNGTGETNNAAMASGVNSTPGAIGYIEYSYVLIPGNAKIQVADLQDAAGKFIAPSLTTIAAAAAAAKGSLTAANFAIVYEPGANVWPFATYSWAIIKRDQANAALGEDAVKYLDWASQSGGQQYAEANGYVPLPAGAQAYARAQLLTVESDTGTVLVNNKN